MQGGVRQYEDLVDRAEPIDLEQRRCWVVTLPTLISLKRAAGRPKDLEMIAQLEAIAEERSH